MKKIRPILTTPSRRLRFTNCTAFSFLFLSACAFAAVLGLSGCAGLQAHRLRQKYYDEMMGYIGKPKDAYVQTHGAPSDCTPLDAGGEVCTWKVFLSAGGGRSSLYGGGGRVYGGGSSFSMAGERHVIFVYDKDHIAIHWTIKPVNNQTYSDTDDRGAL